MAVGRAVFLHKLKGRGSEIRGSEGRVLLAVKLKGEKLVILRSHHHCPVLETDQVGKILLVMDPFSGIEVSRLASGEDADYVADPVVKQMKLLCFFMKNNVHRLSLPF